AGARGQSRRTASSSSCVGDGSGRNSRATADHAKDQRGVTAGPGRQQGEAGELLCQLQDELDRLLDVFVEDDDRQLGRLRGDPSHRRLVRGADLDQLDLAHPKLPLQLLARPCPRVDEYDSKLVLHGGTVSLGDAPGRMYCGSRTGEGPLVSDVQLRSRS